MSLRSDEDRRCEECHALWVDPVHGMCRRCGNRTWEYTPDRGDVDRVVTDVLAEQFALLNDYTRAVLTEAVEAAKGLPEGCGLSVSADSDVVLRRPDGHWVGIRMRWVDDERRWWEPWRGSLFSLAAPASPSLIAALRPYTAG